MKQWGGSFRKRICLIVLFCLNGHLSCCLLSHESVAIEDAIPVTLKKVTKGSASRGAFSGLVCLDRKCARSASSNDFEVQYLSVSGV